MPEERSGGGEKYRIILLLLLSVIIRAANEQSAKFSHLVESRALLRDSESFADSSLAALDNSEECCYFSTASAHFSSMMSTPARPLRAAMVRRWHSSASVLAWGHMSDIVTYNRYYKYLGDELLQQLLHRHRGLLQRHELAPHSLATLRILE